MSGTREDSSSREGGQGEGCTPAMLAARAAGSIPPGDMPPLPPEGGRVVMSWSGGKDSAMALRALQIDPRYEVVGLLTTVSRQFLRVSHHGVREDLLQRQADSVGLPLHRLYFGSADGDRESASMEAFEAEMGQVLAGFRRDGVLHVGYGDIFLAELRTYREQRLASVGMRGVFPLWQRDTSELLHHFTDEGFRAVITCVEPVAASLAGADLSSSLLTDAWPDGVDACGEHGEFHSFVHDGPIFAHPVRFERGETVVRDGRHYTDLIASDSDSFSPTLEGCRDATI